jgi:hypothetical protein
MPLVVEPLKKPRRKLSKAELREQAAAGALAGSSVDPSAIVTSATDLRTSHYDDYSVVFVELQTKR